MTQPPPPADGTPNPPDIQYTQEVRFAVVMYGGSSLAIYMNGVAQELLRLVRATAPAPPAEEGEPPKVAHLPAEKLRGSERVYRKLGQMLTRGEEPRGEVKETDALRTRFVIDILTGTSAGGINAVYLAKALANDQSLDELKGLWISEGDIGVLLNDAKSDKEIGLGGQRPPRSLLNSRRMYFKLLEALRGMDKARRVGDEEQSPLVDELDLFVTATDMNGRLLPLRLADGVAQERRHRSVFRFRYFTEKAGGEHRNDFLPAYNPFLAFASRCTSAHQAAFEVMRLADIEPDGGRRRVLRAGEYNVESKELEKFYADYLSPTAAADGTVKFSDRSFSDGGVLDNSPFSYASDALPFRHADWPVDRKLVYIEPSPEHPELNPEAAERPDFFSNVVMALSTLPRYQTIVEDLMRVLERNRLVERVGHIILGLEDDLKWKRTHRADYKEPPRLTELLNDREKALRWAMEKRNDLSWGGYQRLRAADVTDDLTLLVARAAGFDEQSDQFTAIRYLVRDWRNASYYEELPADEEGAKRRLAETDQEPQAMFLLHFDLMWVVRRLKFVMTKVNEISCFDDRAWQVLEAAREAGDPQLWAKPGEGEKEKQPSRELRAAMRPLLQKFKRDVAKAFTGLRVARRKLWTRGEENPFLPYIAALDIGSQDLLGLLGQPNDKERRRYAAEMLLDRRIGEYPALPRKEADARRQKTLERMRALIDSLPDGPDKKALSELFDDGRNPATRREAVAALTAKVRAELRKATGEAGGRCAHAIAPPEEPAGGGGAAAPGQTDLEKALRKTLWYYYRHFDEYDQVSYPILHSTDVGEELDPVEVFRISPEDATFLIDENKRRESGDSRNHKLAGTTLGHFGAFFEERFRRNDIMWGRLDAAERLIRALLPNDAHEELRDQLVYEAQREILLEEAAAEERSALGDLARALGGAGGAGVAAQLDAKMEQEGLHPSVRRLLRSFLDEGDASGRIKKFKEDFRLHFDETYEEGHAFTPRATVLNAGRASRIFGRMVDGIAAERRRGGSRLVLWLVRLTRWVWGLAEVAVPGSVSNLFGLHLLRVLYFVEVVLVVLGVLFAWKEAQRFGLVALFVTGSLHALLLFVGDFILGGPTGGKSFEQKLWRWVKFILRLLLVVAVVGGLFYLLFMANSSWLPWLIDRAIKWLGDLKKGLNGAP